MALKSKAQLITFYAAGFLEKHFKGIDDWVLNFRIELNTFFDIRKAFILYFMNDIIKLQQRNEKDSVKPLITKNVFRRKMYLFIFFRFSYAPCEICLCYRMPIK